MTAVPAIQRVEILFVGRPPVREIERASGVSAVEVEVGVEVDVEAEGAVVRCLVAGSFQPFLEALRGHEVISLQSIPVTPPRPSQDSEGANT